MVGKITVGPPKTSSRRRRSSRSRSSGTITTPSEVLTREEISRAEGTHPDSPKKTISRQAQLRELDRINKILGVSPSDLADPRSRRASRRARDLVLRETQVKEKEETKKTKTSSRLISSLRARQEITQEALKRGRGFTRQEIKQRLKEKGTSLEEFREASRAARAQLKRTGVSVTEQIRLDAKEKTKKIVAVDIAVSKIRKDNIFFDLPPAITKKDEIFVPSLGGFIQPDASKQFLDVTATIRSPTIEEKIELDKTTLEKFKDVGGDIVSSKLFGKAVEKTLSSQERIGKTTRTGLFLSAAAIEKAKPAVAPVVATILGDVTESTLKQQERTRQATQAGGLLFAATVEKAKPVVTSVLGDIAQTTTQSSLKQQERISKAREAGGFLFAAAIERAKPVAATIIADVTESTLKEQKRIKKARETGLLAVGIISEKAKPVTTAILGDVTESTLKQQERTRQATQAGGLLFAATVERVSPVVSSSFRFAVEKGGPVVSTILGDVTESTLKQQERIGGISDIGFSISKDVSKPIATTIFRDVTEASIKEQERIRKIRGTAGEITGVTEIAEIRRLNIEAKKRGEETFKFRATFGEKDIPVGMTFLGPTLSVVEERATFAAKKSGFAESIAGARIREESKFISEMAESGGFREGQRPMTNIDIVRAAEDIGRTTRTGVKILAVDIPLIATGGAILSKAPKVVQIASEGGVTGLGGVQATTGDTPSDRTTGAVFAGLGATALGARGLRFFRTPVVITRTRPIRQPEQFVVRKEVIRDKKPVFVSTIETRTEITQPIVTETTTKFDMFLGRKPVIKKVPAVVQVSKTPEIVIGDSPFIIETAKTGRRFSTVSRIGVVGKKISLKEFQSLTKQQQFLLQRRAMEIEGGPVALRRVPFVLSKEPTRQFALIKEEPLLRITTRARTSDVKLVPGRRDPRFSIVSTETTEVLAAEGGGSLAVSRSLSKRLRQGIPIRAGQTPGIRTTTLTLPKDTPIDEAIKFLKPADIKRTPFSQTFQKQVVDVQAPIIPVPRQRPVKPGRAVLEAPTTRVETAIPSIIGGIGGGAESRFAGTMQFEVTTPQITRIITPSMARVEDRQIELDALGIRVVTDTIPEVRVETKVFQLERVSPTQRRTQKPAQILIPSQAQKPAQRITQKPAQRITQKPAQILRLAQAQSTAQILRPAQTQPPRPRPLTKPKTPKVPTPIFKPVSPLLSRLTEKVEKDELFKVFARKEGKDVVVAKAKTEAEAFKILKKKLKGTLRASGFVEKAGKKISIPLFLNGEFRRSKVDSFRIVEKKGRRLRKSTTGKEIQMFRPLAGTRKRSKKKSSFFGF